MAVQAFTPRPTGRELAGELRAVAADLPRFLTAPLYRTRPATAVFGVALVELGDYAMMRRMLLGIRERAEGR